MNKKYEKEIGQRIRHLREKANITQEQLSAKLQLEGCDITRSALAKIEVGQRHLYPDEIYLLKKILSISYEDIFE
ncbi:MAG: helix-turn-helix transcriptional regulator [Ruminococcaceae bacterium]|nr:helix-turn-helix transcriptional regulator [Oscillospiraceae bacterium]